MQRRWCSAAVLVALALAAGLLFGRSAQGEVPATEVPSNEVPAAETAVTEQGFYMGTFITVEAHGENARKAAEESMARIENLEAMMTVNAEGSEIDFLNASAGNGQSVPLSEDSIYVLKTAQQYEDLSQGTFDITVGPLVKAWGVITPTPRVPAQEEIDELLGLVDYHDLLIDDVNNTAQLMRPGQQVDLGGIAKGYAGDEVIEVLKANGVESGFVNLGGNVVALGAKPDGNPWNVGIRDPRPAEGSDQSSIGVLQVVDKAVVTSGDYERYFMQDGVRYHHILDPRTGYPARSGVISVTIIADSSIEADALAKPAFILGLTEGMALVESIPGIEAVFITEDKRVYTTPGLADNFVLTDSTGAYTMGTRGADE